MKKRSLRAWDVSVSPLEIGSTQLFDFSAIWWRSYASNISNFLFIPVYHETCQAMCTQEAYTSLSPHGLLGSLIATISFYVVYVRFICYIVSMSHPNIFGTRIRLTLWTSRANNQNLSWRIHRWMSHFEALRCQWADLPRRYLDLETWFYSIYFSYLHI